MKPVYIEIGQSSLRALDGHDGLQLALERQPDGRLTPECVERLGNSLRVFLRKRSLHSTIPAICAIGARGVSLRRLSLPAASKEEMQKLLLLQMEREFPLSPGELAWGYRLLGRAQVPRNGSPAVQELIVAALKREALEEYAQILSACGLSPVFTLGSLARAALCANTIGSFAALDVGHSQSELIVYEGGYPHSIRIVPWGGQDITRGLEKRLQIGVAEAEKLKLRLQELAVGEGELAKNVQAALEAELAVLADLLPTSALGQKLYVTGESARLKGFVPALTTCLGGKVACERLEAGSGEGRSAAILGLQKLHEQDADGSALLLELSKAKNGEPLAQPTPWKWPLLAGVLVMVSLGLRYLEPFIQKPRLERKFAQLQAARAKLPNVDRELAFLQYLKTNQPAYLDALYTLANSVSRGVRVEALSLNRRGDFSLRAGLRDSQQVSDLRSKLIDSGVFTSVVVEDQTPTPDRQKVNVRVTGQWRATGGRKAATNEVSRAKGEKIKALGSLKMTNPPLGMTNDQ